MVYRKKGTVGEEGIRILDLLNQKAVSHGGSLLSTSQKRVTRKAINADKLLGSVKRTGRPGAIGSAPHL